MGKDEQLSAWADQDTRDFLEFGEFFVPDRAVQIRTVCGLIPERADGGLVVDLCSGAGHLTCGILERHERATVEACDGSEAMLAHTRTQAARRGLGDRLTTRQIELADSAWRTWDQPLLAVVSSLAIHHLDACGKRSLYADVFNALEDGGRLIVADLVEPTSDLGRRVAAEAWDDAVRTQANAAGAHQAYERFLDLKWNYYESDGPDEVDQPSALFSQLDWLREIGYCEIDVWWLRAGHAIFGATRRLPNG